MPIIRVEIMKTIDERETQIKTEKKNKQRKKQRQKRARGNWSYNERVKAKWFYCAFKLGASLIFKLNLELALSVILK